MITFFHPIIFRAIAKEILQGEQNMKEALECEWISKDETSTTLFKELIKRMPGKLNFFN